MAGEIVEKKCEHCGALNNRNSRYCWVCEHPLEGWNVDHVSNLPYARTLPQAGLNLLYLQMPDTAEVITFDMDKITKLLVGRSDTSTSTLPDINLDPFHGRLKGVSRKHALIIRQDNQCVIVDTFSSNGTFLNGQRLPPNEPRFLRHGDELRFGNLTTQVFFQVDFNQAGV